MNRPGDPVPGPSPDPERLAGILGRMLDSECDPQDVVDLARALPPGSAPMAGSLLRQAFVRQGHGRRFSRSQLADLAQTCAQGAGPAWEQANTPPLCHWLVQALEGRQGSVEPWRALDAIAMATPDALRASRSRGGASLAEALLDSSSESLLGLEPFQAYARALGLDPATLEIPGRDGPRRAIVLARSPKALDLLAAAGHDLRADHLGRPLWEAMRERARSRRDEDLLAALDRWAKDNEGPAEEARLRKEYFDRLSGYSGEDALRGRKDWHEVRDEKGRTAMMALAMGSPVSLRAWNSVKKALPAASAKDHDGRTLWHYFLAKGKLAPIGSAAFLAKHASPSMDSLGRGLLPSVLAMRDHHGRAPSEHELMFENTELTYAAKSAPDAFSWFACPDPREAEAFADWMANSRHIGSGGSHNRCTEALATLARLLDPLSFHRIHPAVAGALAFCLAMRRSNGPFGDPERVLAALLAHGAHVELSPERRELLARFAKPSEFSMIRAAFGAVEEARALVAHIDGAGSQAPKTPSKRI